MTPASRLPIDFLRTSVRTVVQSGSRERDAR
jgi:hypothetical protein